MNNLLENKYLVGGAVTIIILSLFALLSAFLSEPEPEGYFAYADSTIFQEGKVVINYVPTSCAYFDDEKFKRCHADLEFKNRAVGFVNYLKENKSDD